MVKFLCLRPCAPCLPVVVGATKPSPEGDFVPRSFIPVNNSGATRIPGSLRAVYKMFAGAKLLAGKWRIDWNAPGTPCSDLVFKLLQPRHARTFSPSYRLEHTRFGR